MTVVATLPRLPADVFNGSNAADHQAMVTASGAPVPILYGTQRIGAHLFAIKQVGNELILGCGWCLGPVSSIELNINGHPPPTGVTVTHYLGTDTQGVDPTLAAAIDGYADTLRMTVRGKTVAIAYSVVKIPKGKIAGWPRIEAVVTRAPLAVGASPSDPALALADFLSSPVYGRGWPVDADSIEDTSDANNELLADGMPRREINLLIADPLPVAQWTDILRSYASCYIPRRGGVARLVPDRPASPVADLTDADIRLDTLRLIRRSLRDAPTVVTVVYTDTSATPWRPARATAYAPGVLSGDAPWREETVNMPGITRYSQAYREAVERLNYALHVDLHAEWSAFDEAVQLEEGDVVTLTVPAPFGLTAKPFRILAVEREEPGRWRIEAAEYSANIYADDIGDAFIPDTGLPSPDSIDQLQDLTVDSGTAHLLRLADGTILSRIRIEVVPPDDIYYDYAQVEYRRDDDVDWTPAAPAAGNAFYAAPVEDGRVYIIRARAVNSFGIPSEWRQTTHEVVGKTAPPPPPEAFLFSQDADGTRRFSCRPPTPTPVDFEGFMLRFRLGTGHTWEDMAPLHEGILTSMPWETNTLAAGTYTFAAVSVDTTGNLSTPVYIVAELGNPRLANALEVKQYHVDGWPDGVKTNCWVDPSTGWLVAVDTKTWADFATDGVTWENWTQWARAPATMIYETPVIDVGIVTRFVPLLSAEYAGSATLEINYSDDNITWAGWQVVTGQISARYIKARATVEPVANGFTALQSMTLILDAKTITEDISDLNTAALAGSYRLGAGDVRIPITENYALIRKVEVAIQNVGAGWTWTVVDKDTTVGPRVKVYNGSGVLADAVIDVTIRGV